ncbi:restriction endonuclease subunit S [Weissella cibaria]|uniref:restriction endonuclease subunit S n=1 Tax=Weissella cibaria TaxID=137591 RepID=UPI00193413D3|nr:restriction endonuclease subunit S [Weissella cibaria]
MSNKVPQIRFNGYSDDWEERKLKDVSTYIRGSFPQPYTNPDFYDETNGKPFVQVADIGYDLKLKPDTKSHISKLAESKSRFVEAGKVVVALQGSIETSIGRTAITQYDAFFDRTILIFKEYKVPIDKQYFSQIIKKLFEREKERAWGATISTITKEHLNDFIVGVPSIEEQQKIGTFFKQLDGTIALHQRKLDLLKEQKKGYFQKMFPKNGAKVPELRFAGFADDWEERKLRDLLNKNSEKNKNLSVINVESVSNKTGFTKQTDQFEDYSVASADLSNYYVIREKQFAYNPSRINVGSIAYKDLGDEISVVSPLYVSFSTKKVLNDGFLWNWFKTASFDAQRQRLSEGGVRDTLSFNQLSEMNTMFPTYPEQEKIGSFFKQLDNTIALHQRKLDLLKEQKKGFLQKMFV